MENKKSACRVRRTGVAVRVGQEITVIEIDGRPVAVPFVKLTDDVRQGDAVEWNGSRWERSAEKP